MKKTILRNLMLLSMISLTMLVSCSKDEDSENSVPTKEDVANYYVKYHVFATSGFSGAYLPLEITCTTGIPINTFSTQGNWEETFGPFKKGEKIHLDVKGNSILTGRIYVSKNQEPFSLKVDKNGTRSISLEYTIDF